MNDQPEAICPRCAGTTTTTPDDLKTWCECGWAYDTATRDPNRDLVGMATMILPKMELDHIEQWLRHNISLGIRFFWIWHDGVLAKDIVYDDHGDSGTWKKKGHANFNHNLAPAEVDAALMKIFEAVKEDHPQVTITLRGVANLFAKLEAPVPLHIGKRQGVCVGETMKAARSQCEWLAFFDVDELIVGDLWFLKSVPKHRLFVCAHHWLMQDRWDDEGKARKFKDIKIGHGIVHANHKSFCRTDSGIGHWDGPHTPKEHVPRHFLRWWDLAFYHFHGRKNHVGFTGKSDRELNWLTHAEEKERPLNRHATELGGLILGCPRSGTSLFAQLLNQSGRYHSLGESHHGYIGGDFEGIGKQVRHQTWQLLQQSGTKWCRPCVDKLVDIEDQVDHKDPHATIDGISPVRWVIIRHPLAIWKSQVQLGLPKSQQLLAWQFEWLLNYVQRGENTRCTHVISYYTFTNPANLRNLFGMETDELTHWETEGTPGWGDPVGQERHGRKVRLVTEEDDVCRAKEFFGEHFTLYGEMRRAIEAYDQLTELQTV